MDAKNNEGAGINDSVLNPDGAGATTAMTQESAAISAPYARINQSIFDESQITEEQPSFYDPKGADKLPPQRPRKDSRTGKFTSNDLRPNKMTDES